MILPLEKQVNNLELGRRLKELGVRQESAFYWVKLIYSSDWSFKPRVGDYGLKPYHELRCEEINPKDIHGVYAAFTVAELGEMLPWEIGVHFDKWNDQWLYYYGDMDDKPYSNTEADARAKCLVYLIEQGIVKP